MNKQELIDLFYQHLNEVTLDAYGVQDPGYCHYASGRLLIDGYTFYADGDMYLNNGKYIVKELEVDTPDGKTIHLISN